MIDLLNAYELKYEIMKHYNGIIKKAVGMFKIDYQYLMLARRFHPDILVSMGSPYSSHISRIIRKPHITFADTPANQGSVFYYVSKFLHTPFTDIICTPDVYPKRFHPQKHIIYKGYHELAYLHPNYFKSDTSVLKQVGLTKNDIFIIMRFAGWNAIHDIGQRGFRSIKERIDFVKELEKHCRVIITSEVDIPELKKDFLELYKKLLEAQIKHIDRKLAKIDEVAEEKNEA